MTVISAKCDPRAGLVRMEIFFLHSRGVKCFSLRAITPSFWCNKCYIKGIKMHTLRGRNETKKVRK